METAGPLAPFHPQGACTECLTASDPSRSSPQHDMLRENTQGTGLSFCHSNFPSTNLSKAEEAPCRLCTLGPLLGSPILHVYHFKHEHPIASQAIWFPMQARQLCSTRAPSLIMERWLGQGDRLEDGRSVLCYVPTSVHLHECVCVCLCYVCVHYLPPVSFNKKFVLLTF